MKILSLGLFLYLTVSSFAQAPSGQMISVVLSAKGVSSTETYTYSVFDVICARPVGNFTLKGGTETTISVCSSGTGKATFKVTNITTGGRENTFSLVGPGERANL